MHISESAPTSLAVSTTKVFFTPVPVPSIIDIVTLRGGTEVGMWSNQTLEQIRLKEPQAAIADEATVIAAQEAASTTDAVEITEDDYHDALDALPPSDYVLVGRTSSFKMSEHLRGRITAVYCHINGRYFSFDDVASIRHEAILLKVRKTFAV